jgi:hypothetical protein
LRKAIKIKAFTIFSAWLVIFAHSIIPHNHLPENSTACNELFHEISTSDDDCNIASRFESQPGEIRVCHFSNFLFNQFNQDNILVSTEREAYISPLLLPEALTVNKTESFISIPYHGSSTLRGPPSI